MKLGWIFLREIMMTKPHQHQYRSNPPHFHQHQWHVWRIYHVIEHPPLLQWAKNRKKDTITNVCMSGCTIISKAKTNVFFLRKKISSLRRPLRDCSVRKNNNVDCNLSALNSAVSLNCTFFGDFDSLCLPPQ